MVERAGYSRCRIRRTASGERCAASAITRRECPASRQARMWSLRAVVAAVASSAHQRNASRGSSFFGMSTRLTDAHL